MLPCDPETYQEQCDSYRDVLPSIESPLSVPCKLQLCRERREVRYGPGVPVRPAGADKVTEQVKMKAQEREKSCYCWTSPIRARDLWAEAEACRP